MSPAYYMTTAIRYTTSKNFMHITQELLLHHAANTHVLHIVQEPVMYYVIQVFVLPSKLLSNSV